MKEDPAAEYRAARGSAGIAERTDLAHLVLRGRDPVKMLHGLITNDLAGAAADRVVYGAMLTPKGRTIAELRAGVVDGEGGREVFIDLPREVLPAVTAHLVRSVPPLYARVQDVSSEVATIGVYGPRSRELVEQALSSAIPALEEDERREASFGNATVRVVGTRYAGGEVGFDLTLPASEAPLLVEALVGAGEPLGARRIGLETLEILRIEAGRPRAGHELTEESIPTEAFESTGLMGRAISFTKGCYTGQEVIVRIAHRGHVNRHLRGLVGAGAELPSPGAHLYHPESGKDVGWITSAAQSPLVGAPVALGFVRREVEPGGFVALGAADGAKLRVVALPFQAERSDG